MTRVVVLGGGPAGVGAAWRLRDRGRADVVVIERSERVGGNSGSFEHEGHHLDYGSHRLHPACDAEILSDIGRFLGDDLLDRPRHGRIHLLGKWVHFPLKPADLLLHLDKSFALGSLRDAAGKLLPKKPSEGDETFASVLEASLGKTICKSFYFPYARKIWGRDPAELSPIQARKRVSAGSFTKLFKKVLTSVPGLKPPGAGRFFYPRKGFGQISEAYASRAREAGADLWMGWTVTAVVRRGEGFSVTARRGDEERSVDADFVWSTIPVTLLAGMLEPGPPAELVDLARQIDYRAMLLVYAELDAAQFTEYDAHYFPGEAMAITRMSEPKNYAARSSPTGTVLCAELPAQVDDEHWRLSDAELGELLVRDLRTAGLELPAPPRNVFTRRLSHAYPIYQRGYENAFDPLDEWVGGVPRLLSYGRQGLFAHDNTHHALAMAYAAVECLADGRFDGDRWAEYREVFRTHVVED